MASHNTKLLKASIACSLAFLNMGCTPLNHSSHTDVQLDSANMYDITYKKNQHIRKNGIDENTILLPLSNIIEYTEVKPIEYQAIGLTGKLVFGKCVYLGNIEISNELIGLVFAQNSAKFDDMGNFWYRGKIYKEGEIFRSGYNKTLSDFSNTNIKKYKEKCGIDNAIFLSY